MHTYRIPVVVTGMILALVLAAPASAQSQQLSSSQPQQQSGGGVGFGVEFGGTFTHLRGTDITDVKSKSGVMGGVWFGGNRAGILGFMGELTYVVKSAAERGTDSQLKLHYLEIPAVLRVNIGAPGKSSPCLYFLGGPVVDILLKGDLDGLDVKDQFNGYDAGVLGGVGFEVLRIGAELRGNWGLKSLVNNSGTFQGSDAKSLSIQIVGKIRIN
jgi:hypothetical protein